ncbi:MAG: hypothetical protein ACYTG0_20330 [Planctomycetota bacterium]|jgi:hypothetical protein
MKSLNEEQKLAEGRSNAKKPRFRIEKLEERIAPKKPPWAGHDSDEASPGYEKTHGR